MRVGVRGRVHNILSLGVELPRVSPIVGIEGSHSRRRGFLVIVDMFRHREEVGPIVLFLVDEWSNVGFNNLINSFRLSICLRVKAGGHSRSNS